jgi:hypothetical protein
MLARSLLCIPNKINKRERERERERERIIEEEKKR